MRVLMQIAASDGFTVTGSDLATTGHDEKFIAGADKAVYSSAIPASNPERVYAEQHGIPLVSRAEFLGQVAQRYGMTIAVAGSHGKTTTTAMLGSIFAPSNATVHLGGEYNGQCGHVGNKRVLITEACEYKRNFLYLRPRISVVLNVELDHTDYYRDLDDITSAFDVFSRSAPVRIICGDDERSAPLRTGRFVTFGLSRPCDYRAENIRAKCGSTQFELWFRASRLGEITLAVMGEHNVYNALAASAAAMQAGMRFGEVKRGLESFVGVKRRLELLGSVGECDVYTDYAHHPREIESTLRCLRSAGYERICVVFEPHTYSRTAALLDSFATALCFADDILLADIYAAREDPLPGVSTQLLCRKILDTGRCARCYCNFFELNEAVMCKAKNDTAIVYCGAGTIDTAARNLMRN